DDRTCPACDRPFRTAQGMMAHLSSAKSCKWYRKGKNPVPHDRLVPEVVEQVHAVIQDSSDADEEPLDFHDIMENRDLFRFVLPTSTVDDGPNGDQALDDDEDTRVEDEDPRAGRVIRMEETVVDTWKAYFGEDVEQEDPPEDAMDVDGVGVDEQAAKDPNLKWKPFASELDWRVAMWAVREDVGQNSLNRFLLIPGVVEKLELSFKDVRQLFQKVDSIPDRASWQTATLTFPDRPDEKHMVRYRDIIEAIKALVGNPAHAKHIVYRPKRVFADQSRLRRIYTEMWTGLW
ncbi:uncharacterized protein B0H18DRAFT_823376, partial [Fomitopsis serialis]|uniref:uncharacterized protein n=1 Tax=Fomitopsis serialis TaxID=139415 RepID=UPI002007E1E8